MEGLREALINRETDVILANPDNIVKHRGEGPVFLSEEYQRLVEGLREAHINREPDVFLANPDNIVKHRGGGVLSSCQKSIRD